MENLLRVRDYLFILQAHYMKAVNIILIGIALSIFYALSLPPTYQTTAVVQILRPEIVATNSQIQTNSAALHRLQVIKQQLLSRNNLKAIIESNNYYSGPEELLMVEKIELLRKSIQLLEIQSENTRWRPDSSPTSLHIIVSDSNPQQAARIANELSEMLITISRESNASQTKNTLAFFESENARIEAEVAKLDVEISKFKQVNADLMPEGLTSLRRQLSLLDESTFRLDSDIVSLTSATNGVENQFTLRKLEQLEQQRDLIGKSREVLIAQLARGPEVERGYATLTRKMEHVSDQLRIINRNRAEAEMNEMIESSSQESNFRLLDPALVPKDPISPNKRKIVLIGIMMSIVAAIALIALLEQNNGIIRTSSQMEAQLGLEPVMTMPTLRKPRRFFAKAKRGDNLYDATQASFPKHKKRPSH